LRGCVQPAHGRPANRQKRPAAPAPGAVARTPSLTTNQPTTHQPTHPTKPKTNQQEALDAARRVGFQKAGRRAFQAAEAIAAVARDAAVAAASGKPIDPPERLLRRVFEALGSTYLKLGQLIASSPSVFPPELVEEMQACLDATPETPWPEVERILREELAGASGGAGAAAATGAATSSPTSSSSSSSSSRSLESVFESVDRKPLASASVAQVHRAVLRGSGKEVVLKVLKPGAEDALTMDLDALYIGARLAELLLPELARRLSLRAVVSDARQALRDEVDLRKEALHIAAFRDFLERRGLTSVACVPETYPALSSRRVLVMQRLDGVPLTDLRAVAAHLDPRCGVSPEQALLRALNVWALSVADERAGTFHGDLHSGNLLVLRDGKAAFIDWGIVGRLGPGTRAGLSALGEALAMGDYERAARALGAIGAVGGGGGGGGGSDGWSAERDAGKGAWAEAGRAEAAASARWRREQGRASGGGGGPRFEGRGGDLTQAAEMLGVGDGVDYAAFGRDLAAFAASLDALSASASLVVVEGVGGGSGSGGGVGGSGARQASTTATTSVQLDVDPAALNRLALDLARISEKHGVRLPRDFALLFKQAIFFQRYAQALAPGLDMRAAAADAFSAGGGGGGGGGGGASFF
jgi:predicted unusual protein kinase regulating ubiquinone biosynthesis (AarF/ABC1/UbiB family)